MVVTLMQKFIQNSVSFGLTLHWQISLSLLVEMKMKGKVVI